MRSHLLRVGGAVAAAALIFSFAACSQDKEVVQAADASIGIETSQMFVTIENRAGTPLLDLTTTIQTPSAPYTYLITRIEAGQKRDVPVNSFSSRDGTALNLRLVRPRAVRAAAKDLTGKSYESQVGWK
jgi:hypothetical protein